MKKKNDIPKIFDDAIVKSYRYGNTLEITTAHGLREQTIKVISNKRYVDLRTGEIKLFDTSANTRVDNLESVKQTMKKLRRLITHNFTGGKNQLWITLTYRNHVTDSNIAYRDFKVFMKSIRRKYGEIEYISVIEPQASGRWHFHVLMKNDSSLTIPNSEIEQSWKQGFTKTKRLKTSDKVGNYVIAYLSNLEVPINQSEKNNKKYIKGARLYYYPKGIRIYRRSKGIENPVEATDRKDIIVKTNNISNQKANHVKKTTHKTQGIEITYITEFFDDIGVQKIIKEDAIMPTKANDDTFEDNS